MKKSNKSMRVSAVLLVMVLLTSCFVGGTFAKYTTKDTGSDSARVAKWGVTVKATSDSAFKSTYATTDSSARGAGITTSVNSIGGNVIAPGTSGEITGVKIIGKPEVAVEVSNTATVNLGENWTDADGNYYCPIVFTVKTGDTTVEIDGKATGTYDTAAALQKAVKDEIEKATARYNSNTDLSKLGETTSNKSNLSVSWKWDFEGDNEKDTFLASKQTGSLPSIQLDITTTVTQID